MSKPHNSEWGTLFNLTASLPPQRIRFPLEWCANFSGIIPKPLAHLMSPFQQSSCNDTILSHLHLIRLSLCLVVVHHLPCTGFCAWDAANGEDAWQCAGCDSCRPVEGEFNQEARPSVQRDYRFRNQGKHPDEILNACCSVSTALLGYWCHVQLDSWCQSHNNPSSMGCMYSLYMSYGRWVCNSYFFPTKPTSPRIWNKLVQDG